MDPATPDTRGLISALLRSDRASTVRQAARETTAEPPACPAGTSGTSVSRTWDRRSLPPARPAIAATKERPMQEKLISADNHIDLTYCPPDLWSEQAPREWRDKAPRTEERDDGLHWIVDGEDKGMWNGVGPGFLKYQKGSFHHVDEMKEA